ncbi:class C sortase [Corynebacterium diphtheriae]|uniref:class B sortase SrtB n=1 Tax=Corynebacterium diphtheriae TaxID=1717 RepID=UPI00089376F5|nr:class B sortase SrtB [Corynebacterium diphtheriae]OFI53240.1 class C sortase [Corynebacterium diphtheriae]OFI61342.1 class C sortase [Corynebacterium diphtheriae]OSQ16684.1 class C sortase [Corynebacterium diphtheriae]
MTDQPPTPNTTDATPPRQDKKLNTNAIIAVVLILAGLGVLLYPVLATQWNNYQQSRAADAYSQLEKGVPSEVLNKAWEEAQQYNASLGDIDPGDAWTSSDDESSPAYQRYLKYLSVLNETEAMGRIVLPSIKSDLPIFHGTSDRVLARGVGHLYGTDLPIGAPSELDEDGAIPPAPPEGRLSALSAHTGLQNATLWDNLIQIKKGDPVYVAAAGEKLKYEVRNIEVVTPDKTSLLRRTSNKDQVTLITCTPYGINTHRLIITAERVPMDPQGESAFDGQGTTWQWWMWAILAAAAIIVLLLIRWWWKNFRKQEGEEGPTTSGAGGTTES